MTTTATHAHVGPLVANGVNPIPFDFQAIAIDEVGVVKDGVDIGNTGFTVALNADGTGSVTPLASWGTSEIYVYSMPDFQNTTEFQRFVKWYADAVNVPLDVVTRQILALNRDLQRTFRVPLGKNGAVLPAGTSGMLGIDASGDAVFHPTGSFAGPVGPAGDVAKANDRTALAAIAGAAAKATRWLAEAGRNGVFEFDSSDLSVEVTADTAQGIYVPPTGQNGSTGAWVRKFEGPLNPAWFGLIEGNAAGANGAANDTAMAAMDAVRKVRAVNISTSYQGLEPVRFSAGYFEFASTIELTDGTGIIEGADTGYPSARGTQLKFPDGVTGIRVQRHNTSGADGPAGAVHRGGDGTIIRNISLLGAYVATEAEAHGIQLRARALIENVNILSFQGDGVYGNAQAGGDPEGNANNARIVGGRIQSCRNGIYINNADANIWTILSVDTSSNRQWGIWDSSFLGNTIVAGHASNNGLIVGSIPTVVSHGGNRYFVIAGQEVGASTNAPSGTTADNTWWAYNGAGGVNAGANIPAWASGTTYRMGGSYHTDNANARSLFAGCYHESGQGKAQIATPSLVVGGMLGQQVLGSGGVLYAREGAVFGTAFRAEQIIAAGTVTAGVGEAATETILSAKHSVAAPSTWRLKFITGNDMALEYANSAGARPFTITSQLTAQQFGTGAAVLYAFYAPNLEVGDTIANARRLTNGTVAPASGAHGPGEWVINRTPAVGGVAAWACRTAGTPGTWEPVGIVGAVRAAAPSTTYAAPSGGTTIDTEGRASLAQLAADVADLKAKLAAANLTA